MTALISYNQDTIRNLPAEQREQALEFQLDRARTALALALQASDVHMVAQIKSGTAVMEKLSKELKLSKECQLDAAEMVRRSEYALRKAHRSAQDAGYLPNRSGWLPNGHREEMSISTTKELYGSDNARSQIIAFTDDVSDSEFESALSEARDEGNLARVNIARKVEAASTASESRADRADKIGPLARQGLTSEQIAKRLELHRDSVKRIARDHGIDIQADRVTAHRPKVDSAKILESTAAALEGAVYSIRLVQPEDLGQEEALEWVDSLTESIKALSKAVKKIKEYHS